MVTNSEFLNDREEILYSIDIIEEIYKTIDNGVIDIKTLKKLLVDSLKYKFILSFSLNNDSIGLWGNYTNFEGYNIEVDLKNIVGSKENFKKYIIANSKSITPKGNNAFYHEAFGKVIYDTVEQKEILKSLILILNQSLDKSFNLTEEERKVIKEEVLSKILYYINIFKHPGFKQEEEYRLVFTLNKDSYDRVIKFTNRNGVIIPYIEIKFINKDGKWEIPITSITIGPKTNIELAQKGLERLLELHQLYLDSKGEKEDITIVKSQIPYR